MGTIDDRPVESWRARAAVSEALDVFNSSYMQEMWTKALARREADPEGAVTAARALLEAVCKHILDAANSEFREGMPLPRLYDQTAKVLNIAPSQHLAPVFNSIFTACAEVIQSIGILRNELSDSHGRGPFGAMPDWRHAELAVNLSGAMATYLAAVWKGRQPTVPDLIRAFIDRRKPLHAGTLYPLERMAREMDDWVASKVRPTDLVAYFEARAAADKLRPATIQKMISILRSALDGNSAAAFSEAADILKSRKILPSAAQAPRIRRVSNQDFDALVEYLREQGRSPRETKHKETGIGMVDVIEFLIWSGRKPADIFKLRWADVDLQKKTCKVAGKSFPILERAWEVIERRHSNPHDPNGKIFPYNDMAVQMRHRRAVEALVADGKIQAAHALSFLTYRHEAVYRLLERGHPSQVVARATGQPPARVNKISEDVEAGAP